MDQQTAKNQAITESDIQTLRAQRGRRQFFRDMGRVAAGATVAATLGATVRSASAASADLDVAIFQFALNLEYLEAEFYMRAATGNGLAAYQTGPHPGTVTGGSKVPFSSPLIQAYANEIAAEEVLHVEFLRTVLKSLGHLISEPNIDLSSSFKTLGSIAGLGSDFNPYADDMSFMLGAYVFEDVGVTAYHGAAPLITDKGYLDKATGIMATEAYHAGIIRTVLFANGMHSQTAAISNVRATLDQTAGTQNIDDRGVGVVSNPSLADVSFFKNGSLLGGYPNPPPGNNAIAFDRTTRQVLNIVYGGVNATSGLFYPNGLNGKIKS